MPKRSFECECELGHIALLPIVSALRANNAFTPLRSVRSAKNYNSPASSSAVRPSTKKNAITGMTSKSWPIARTLRSAVAAATDG